MRILLISFLISTYLYASGHGVKLLTKVSFIPEKCPVSNIGEYVLGSDLKKELRTLKGASKLKPGDIVSINDILKNKIRGNCTVKITKVGLVEPCHFTSNISMYAIKLQDFAKSHGKGCSSTGCLPQKLFLCTGTVVCKDSSQFRDDTYTATCLSQERDSCPNGESCMNDPFTYLSEDAKKLHYNTDKKSSPINTVHKE